ncbi:hypothetical protein KIN20_003862 [Parelaphostrongylus tenuis]|uniref:Uncharacterized protein n=1 Tax=Parelaphostrongylus tenuis TaxID=148309 RepID=A0AAD5MQI6_PARTN|nr:hypothetical protein KIN20_003862 [Parelaphostrongylus tenuis]
MKRSRFQCGVIGQIIIHCVAMFHLHDFVSANQALPLSHSGYSLEKPLRRKNRM